jgi:hypothetical protein
MSKVTITGSTVFEISSMEIVLDNLDFPYENEFEGLKVLVTGYRSTSQIDEMDLEASSSCDRLNGILDKVHSGFYTGDQPLLENEKEYLEEVLDAVNEVNDSIGPTVS